MFAWTIPLAAAYSFGLYYGATAAYSFGLYYGATAAAALLLQKREPEIVAVLAPEE